LKIHNEPAHFVQVVENALQQVWESGDEKRWQAVHLFYERRYLNPNSAEKQSLQAWGVCGDHRASPARQSGPLMSSQDTIRAIRDFALRWEPDAKLIMNLTARDIAAACSDALNAKFSDEEIEVLMYFRQQSRRILDSGRTLRHLYSIIKKGS
jgi:hypothetical protein